MSTPHYLSLGAAAKATGKSKTTIGKYIKNGKMSAVSKDESGYQIDPAELFRVFTPVDSQSGGSVPPKNNTNYPLSNNALQVELEIIKQERERERRQFEDRVKSLEDRLSETEKERRELSQMLLTAPQKPPEWRKKFLGIFWPEKR